MLNKRGFNLSSRQPVARHVDDIVDTAPDPVVALMITSRTATKHRNYAMELGVNEYLGKPYREADLLEFVAAYTGPAAAVAMGS